MSDTQDSPLAGRRPLTPSPRPALSYRMEARINSEPFCEIGEVPARVWLNDVRALEAVAEAARAYWVARNVSSPTGNCPEEARALEYALVTAGMAP